MTQEELIHYGVLGMKWGRRKNKSEKINSLKQKRLAIENNPIASKKWKAKKSAQVSRDISAIKNNKITDTTKRTITKASLGIAALSLDYAFNNGRITKNIANGARAIAKIIS